MKNIILLLLFISIFSCSSNKVVDLKSPCVSIEDGPCGSKKPINDWWLKEKSNYHKS